jgi:hypothetical protein
MDNLFIISGLLLIVVIFAIFFPIYKHNTVHKTTPVIVRPSYWITPTGPSWYPRRHRYHHEYTSGPSYRHYYRNLNNLYRTNDNNRKKQRRYNNSSPSARAVAPPPPPTNSNNKLPKLKKAQKAVKVSKKEPFNYSYI